MRVAYFCYYGKNPEDGAFAAKLEFKDNTTCPLANSLPAAA